MMADEGNTVVAGKSGYGQTAWRVGHGGPVTKDLVVKPLEVLTVDKDYPAWSATSMTAPLAWSQSPV